MGTRIRRINFGNRRRIGLFVPTACLLLAAARACGATEVGSDQASGRPAAAAERPNFVLIVCDNLGYGDIEPFGATLQRTPQLNRMAREGRKFTHFYVTAGVCTPSRASILTGCYAQRVGMHSNPRDGRVLRPLSPYGLSLDEVTIAEVLHQAGYATAIVGKWHLGDRPEFLPTRQGFDEFHGIPYSDDMTRAVGQRLGRRWQGSQWPPLPWMENETVVEAPVDRNLLTQRCTAEAVAFLRRNRKQPFFLYFPQPMPGSTAAPFASKAFKHHSRNGPWGDAIEEIDWSTGQILDTLVELGLERRTLVIWTSDNGAPLAADPSSLARGSNRPLFGRGYTTAEGGFRVPTIFWWPATVPAGSVCSELATTMDFLPTFARLAGAPLPVGRHLDGHDIGPLVCGRPGAKTPYKAFYYYSGAQLQAVRSGPWKLFLPSTHHPHFNPDAPAAPQLFQLVDDVGSTTNVARQHPDVVRRLLALADAARADLGDSGRKGKGQRPTGKARE